MNVRIDVYETNYRFMYLLFATAGESSWRSLDRDLDQISGELAAQPLPRVATERLNKHQYSFS